MSGQEREDANDDAFRIAAIRTPDDFVAAMDAALAHLNLAVRARFGKLPEAGRLAREATEMALAVKTSPFEMLHGEVIAKGFTPRIVR